MYTLYYFPGACSLAVHSVLEELRVPFQLVPVNLRQGEHFGEAFRALNPAARVPVLVDGDFVLTEAPAILNYLAELYPDAGLLPTESRTRADCWRWLNYASSRLHPAFSRVMVPKRFAAEEQAAQVRTAGEREVVECYQLLEQALAQRDYITGSTIRLPDYLLYVILTWDRMLDRPQVGDYPRLAAYRQRVGARPAVQRAQARETAALASA
jgi:glutathione S-transferase